MVTGSAPFLSNRKLVSGEEVSSKSPAQELHLLANFGFALLDIDIDLPSYFEA